MIPVLYSILSPHGAPVGHTVNLTFQTIFTIIHFSVAGMVTFLAARRPIQMRDWFELRFRLLILIGGGLGAVFFEPAGDRMGQVWYYTAGGQWPLHELYGITPPIWALPVYVTFAGGGTLWIIDRVRKGARASDLFSVFAGITVLDLLIEVPILKFGGLYTYWGDNQPLWDPEWFPLPGWFMVINRLLGLIPALVVLGLMALRQKHLEWFLPILVPCGLFAAYGLAGWPVIMALQDGSSHTVTTIAACVTISLSVGFTLIAVRLLPKMKHLMAVTPTYAGQVRDDAAQASTENKSLTARLAGIL